MPFFQYTWNIELHNELLGFLSHFQTSLHNQTDQTNTTKEQEAQLRQILRQKIISVMLVLLFIIDLFNVGCYL